MEVYRKCERETPRIFVLQMFEDEQWDQRSKST